MTIKELPDENIGIGGKRIDKVKKNIRIRRISRIQNNAISEDFYRGVLCDMKYQVEQ